MASRLKKVLIVGSAKLPNPPVLGGAVPHLIQQIIDKHEGKKDFSLYCYSYYTPEAEKASRSLSNTRFLWAKVPRIIAILDSLVSAFLRLFGKKSLIKSVGYFFRMNWFGDNLKRCLKRESFDVVIFENSPASVRALRNKTIRQKYKGKCYYHAHSIPKYFFGCKQIFRDFLKFITVSNYVSRALSARIGVDDPARFWVMRNCVDASLFKKTDAHQLRKELGFSSEDFVVVFAGLINRDKGIMHLIKALKLLRFEGIKVLIIGSSFYGSGIQDGFVSELTSEIEGYRDRLVFTGYIKNNEMYKYYNCGDIVCLPSVWEDPAPLTVIETMCCGLPLVTTNSGGIPEYAKGAAIILTKEDSDFIRHLADAVFALKEDREKRLILGREARKQMEYNNLDFFYSQFLNVVNNQVLNYEK